MQLDSFITFMIFIRFWRVSPILNARSDWPKCQSVIDDSRFIPNGCVVNIKCGQSNCKFQLTAYQYHFDPEDFNPSPSITTINTDVQGDRSLSGSVDCLKPNNAAYLQVRNSLLEKCSFNICIITYRMMPADHTQIY